jgi:hypothetical protein
LKKNANLESLVADMMTMIDALHVILPSILMESDVKFMGV